MWTITNRKSLKIMKIKSLLISLMVFVIAPALMAQEDQKPYSEEVTIIAPYQPSIQDARKLSLFPEIKVEAPEKKEVKYNIVPQKIPMDVELEPMRAVRVQGNEEVEPLKSNYIRGGIGNYKTAYGELFTTSKQSESHRIGLHLKHLSHGGEINDYATAKNSENLAELFGEKYYKKSSLYGKLFFERNMLHRYGFMPADFTETFEDEDIRQIYTKFGGNIRYENLEKEEDEFDYHLDLGYFGWRDNYNSLENEVRLKAFAEQPAEIFDFVEYQSFAIDADLRFYNSGDSINAINTVNLNITPYIDIKNGFYHLQAGANLSTIMSDEKDAEITAFPYAKAWVHIVPGYVTLTGGISGKKEHQSFRKLSGINPFIKSDITRKFTTTEINTYGALTGNIARGVDFNLKITYEDYRDYPLFVTDFTKTFNNEFKLAYDDITKLGYAGALSITAGHSLEIDMSANYFTYTTTNEAEAWHLPELEISAAATYTPNLPIPLNFKLKAKSLSGRYAKDSNGNAEAMEDILDVSFAVQYEHSSSLGAFLELNNLMAENQYWWHNYPSYGFNALVGVSYSF